MSLRSVIFLLAVLSVTQARSQNWFFNTTDHRPKKDSLPNRWFAQLRYQIGKVTAPETQGIKYIEANPFQSADIRFGVYGYGRKKWHQVHHYPTYGFGQTKFWFSPSDNILGNPIATYFFFNESMARWRTSAITYDFSFGLSYHWKPYNTLSNPEQKAIGSNFNALVGLSLNYETKLSDRIHFTVGPSLTHFSNGRTRSPNRGLNLLGVNASLRYRISNNKGPDQIKHNIEPFTPMYEFYAVGSAGIVTTFKNIDRHGIYFWAGSVSIDAARHYSYRGKYGIGIDWFFDASLKEVLETQYPEGVPNSMMYWPGFHISHEYMIHRWTLITQAGLNLKVQGDKGLWYGRVALRYDLSKSVFARVSLRVYDVLISDFIECGLGYSLYRLKKPNK